jgi:hypothetical protein
MDHSLFALVAARCGFEEVRITQRASIRRSEYDPNLRLRPNDGPSRIQLPPFAAERPASAPRGYEVVSPAEINPNGGTWQECMKRDIAQLMTCNLLAKLPGWIDSRGARLEILLAQRLEIKVAMARSITGQYAEAARPCSPTSAPGSPPHASPARSWVTPFANLQSSPDNSSSTPLLICLPL